jgi:hypothetical protein
LIKEALIALFVELAVEGDMDVIKTDYNTKDFYRSPEDYQFAAVTWLLAYRVPYLIKLMYDGQQLTAEQNCKGVAV